MRIRIGRVESRCSLYLTKIRLCIKVGRGHGDACVGTWDFETRDEGLEDINYGTRDVWDWDAGTCGTGTRGR